MKIIRDGKEFELTPAELRQAHEEMEREYYIEDFRSRYEVPDDKIDEAVDMFDHMLGSNDGYWESYWLTMEFVCNELGIEERDEE